MAAARPLPPPSGIRRQSGALAMPAARPPFPIYVLNQIVNMADLTGELDPGLGWSEIPCASRRAYGCGDNVLEVMEDLVLYKRLGDGPHLNSSLAIRMTEDARRWFESELDPDYYRRRDAKLPSDLIARARVVVAEEHGVTVILLSFTRPASFNNRPNLLYYLVCDTVGGSLTMFQILPHPCEGVYKGVCVMKPIVKRTDGSDYKLLLLGHEESREDAEEDVEEDAEEDAEESRDDTFWVGSLPWVPSKLKSTDFPEGLIHRPFDVDVAFSCQGKAFWGDLKQGLLYCDLQTSDMGFFELPRGYKVDVESGDEPPPLLVRKTRTLGCVGDSIRFVCIDMKGHYTDAVVREWELVLPKEQRKGKGKGTVNVMGEGAEWKEVFKGVPAKVLWEQSSFKKAGLPAAPFQYPILTPDGAVCFVLVDQSLFPRPSPLMDHFCIFDMHSKRLLWHGLVHSYPITDTLVMYPSPSFLDKKQCSLQRSSVEKLRRSWASLQRRSVGKLPCSSASLQSSSVEKLPRSWA